MFISRNSVKYSFGVGRLLAKVGPMPVKCSFIIFGIRDFMLVAVLLFDCFNLVPRVSLLPVPWSERERPWYGLVTCVYEN